MTIFTDAHTSSSVCTPTRYNVLTGRYSWRTTLKRGVLNGYGPPLIAEDRLTLASLLQENGYKTAMIGKWHLGMSLPFKGGKAKGKGPQVDWSQRIERTPTSNGFDYFWGHGASLDFPPYVYIENNHYTSQTVVQFPSEVDYKVPSKMRSGPIADNFDPFQTLDEFCDRTAQFIRKQDGSQPFFVYVPLTSPHTPILPTSEWKGKSGIGDYADFVMQTDAGVGRILDALDEKGFAENTIVIFTADNGCSRTANFKNLESHGHKANGIYRGSKSDLWDGGHRVPHLVRWPARIKAGSTTDRLTVLGDIVDTMADIVGTEIPDNAAEDSLSFYPALIGKKDPSKEHEAIIHHSFSGEFAIRQGDWKLMFVAGSGGWTFNDKKAKEQGLPTIQLYNMKEDPSETTNLQAQFPEKVEALRAVAKKFVLNGRSTPGAPQANDTGNQWPQLHWMK
ncbi:MAG: sulfatase family protein [Opitutales bacterium]